MRVLAFLMALLWAGPAATDPEREARALVASDAVPGAVAGWVGAGGMDWAVGGLRRIDGADAIALDDPWHIGSLTKSMTAVLAARMVEAGLIRWDSTVEGILGATITRIHPAWRSVRLEDLLHHRSGMAANIGPGAAGDGSRAAYVAAMLGAAPEGPRGTFLYSNAGYVVAGGMLEVAGGVAWEELITDHVFAPLHLSSAGFGPPQGEVPEGHRAEVRVGLGAIGQGATADNGPALGPAGRVHIAAEDMLRYLAAHLARDPAFLSAESWDRLHQPDPGSSYAMGWVVSGATLSHSGSNTFWYATALIDRANGRASFVVVNSGMIPRVEAPVLGAAQRLLRGN